MCDDDFLVFFSNLQYQSGGKGMQTVPVCWLDHLKSQPSFLESCSSLQPFSEFPFLCFSLVDSLMLLEMYVSHTISTLLQFCSCFMMCRTKTSSAYRTNVAILVVGSKCITAAPSRSFTSTESGEILIVLGWDVQLISCFSRAQLSTIREWRRKRMILVAKNSLVLCCNMM